MTLRHSSARTWIITAALLIAAIPAFARASREIRIDPGTMLHGQSVPVGTYRLSWKPNGRPDEVAVEILRGRSVVASATGRLRDREAPSEYDSIAYRNGGNGAREIVEIRFAGKKQVIRVEE